MLMLLLSALIESLATLWIQDTLLPLLSSPLSEVVLEAALAIKGMVVHDVLALSRDGWCEGVVNALTRLLSRPESIYGVAHICDVLVSIYQFTPSHSRSQVLFLFPLSL